MKAAIFDMDGTLLDSMWMWRTVLVRYLNHLNIENAEELEKGVTMMGFMEAMEYIVAHADVGMTAEELFADMKKYILHIYETQIELKPYVKEYLTRLSKAGVHLSIATLTDRFMVEAVLKKVGIWDLFDYVITVPEIGVMKNEPDIYEDCLAHAGCEKKDAVVFEDASYCLETAHNAGFICYGIADPWQEMTEAFKAKYCDRFLNDFGELLDEEIE